MPECKSGNVITLTVYTYPPFKTNFNIEDVKLKILNCFMYNV